MTCRRWLASGIVAVVLGTTACGGGGGSAKGAESTQASVSPMDALKKIDEDVNAQVKDLQKPIDEANKALEDFSKLSEKYSIKPEQLSSLAKASFDGKEVTFEANMKLDDAAKQDISETIGRLKAAADQLKAVPEKSTAFTKQLTDYTAQVPTLAGKVVAEANVDLANPLAGADAKARAQANVDGVGALQTQIQATLTDAQTKATSLPALAAETEAKLATALVPPAGKPSKMAAAGNAKKKAAP